MAGLVGLLSADANPGCRRHGKATLDILQNDCQQAAPPQ